MFTSTIFTIISTKFQINLLTEKLFSGSGQKAPPPTPSQMAKSQNAVGLKFGYKNGFLAD